MSNYDVRDLTIAERVKNGSQLLTEHFGDDTWKLDINTDKLSIVDTGLCILGQLFGSFREGTEELGFLDERDTEEFYGFELTYEEYVSELSMEFIQRFEYAWCKEILGA